jgi:hypothetical protein
MVECFLSSHEVLQKQNNGCEVELFFFNLIFSFVGSKWAFLVHVCIAYEASIAPFILILHFFSKFSIFMLWSEAVLK